MASSFLRRMDSQYLESWISFISSRPFYPFYYIINFILCDIFQNVSKVSSPFYGDSSLLQFDGRTHALWWGRICAGGVATRGNYVDPGWGGDQGTSQVTGNWTICYFTFTGARRGCAARLVALLCNTSDTGAVTLGDQRSSAVDTVLICISWSSTHTTSGNYSEIF